MTNDEGWRRYIEAGMALTQITRARAEELVRELVRSGEVERGRAQERVDELVKKSRERSELLLQAVRDEVQSQLRELGMATVEDVAGRVADLLAAAAAAGRAATGQPARRGAAQHAPAERAPAKKAAAKRAPAKKAAAKRAPAKKAAAKKAPAKKAVAKKAVAKATVSRRAPSARTTAGRARASGAPGRSRNG